MKHSLRFVGAVALLAAVALWAGTAQAALIGYWNFDNGVVGGKVPNLVPGHNNPLLIDGTLATSVAVGGNSALPGMKSVNFAGTSGSIQVAADPTWLNFSGNKFTMSMWIKDGYDTSYPRLWKSGAVELQGNTYSDGDAVYFKGNNSGSWKSTSALNPYRGAWHNITLTGNGTNVTFWKDGVAVNTQSQGSVTNAWGTLWIGSTVTRMTGQLGDIAIYNTAETDIAGIMNRTNPEIAAVVPEPSTMALLIVGGLGLIGYRWRKRK